MNILCTICMRGGSKGIKNKNIIKINKKYLYQYTHEMALKCKKITDIVFSTDSNKIINILSKNKKNVIFKRSKRLATDNISKVDVIQDTLIRAEKFYKKKYSYIIDLDVTSPLRNLSDINKSIEIMKKGNFNNLFSVNKSKKNPYFNMVEKKNNTYGLVKKKDRVLSRQKAPLVYDMNASIYIWKRNILIKNTALFSKKTAVHIMPEKRSVDIDNYEDLMYLKFLLNNA